MSPIINDLMIFCSSADGVRYFLQTMENLYNEIRIEFRVHKRMLFKNAMVARRQLLKAHQDTDEEHNYQDFAL